METQTAAQTQGTTAATATGTNKPLLSNGPIIINPAAVLWANIEAVLPKGQGVQILFAGHNAPYDLYGGDAQCAASILLAASQEAPDA